MQDDREGSFLEEILFFQEPGVAPLHVNRCIKMQPYRGAHPFLRNAADPSSPRAATYPNNQ